MKKQFNYFSGAHSDRIYYYANASHGFYDIMCWLQHHRPVAKPNIVMPVYIPAKLYRFALAAGYEVRFYDVNESLGFSLEEIRSLIDSRTQLVFAVHYFGIPVDLQPLKQLTREMNTFLLEDCAHTLTGSYKGRLLGTTGDFAIFSVRKMLNVFCGGFMVINTQLWPFEPSETRKVNSFFFLYHFVGNRLKNLLSYSERGRRLVQKHTPPYCGYINFSKIHKITVRRMANVSKAYLQWVNIRRIAETRRNNVHYLWNRITPSAVFNPIGFNELSEATVHAAKTEYNLVSGYVPFSLPLLLPKGTRNYVQHKLLNKGIRCYPGWPEAPFGLQGFPKTEQLRDRLLELPVHQHMNRYQLRIMAEVLEELSGEMDMAPKSVRPDFTREPA